LSEVIAAVAQLFRAPTKPCCAIDGTLSR
jgi:hypothetical protein